MTLNEWAIVVPLIIAVLGVIGGAIAWTNGVFRTRGTAQEERQKVRDDRATADAARTLDGVFDLVEQLQEEVARRKQEMAAADQLIADLKAEVDSLKTRVRQLELKVQP